MRQPDSLVVDDVMVPETPSEVPRDMKELMDDDFFLLPLAELVETFGDEFEGIKGFRLQRNLQHLAHPVASGHDSSRGRAMTSQAYDPLQVDMPELEGPDNIGETGLDVGRGFIADVP